MMLNCISNCFSSSHLYRACLNLSWIVCVYLCKSTFHPNILKSLWDWKSLAPYLIAFICKLNVIFLVCRCKSYFCPKHLEHLSYRICLDPLLICFTCLSKLPPPKQSEHLLHGIFSSFVNFSYLCQQNMLSPKSFRAFVILKIFGFYMNCFQMRI